MPIPKRYPFSYILPHMFSKTTYSGVRHYIKENKKFPSVTTILEKTKSIDDKLSLERWKQQMGVLKANKIAKLARENGTAMHSFIEDYIDEIPILPLKEFPLAHTMAKNIYDILEQNISEIWGKEVSLFCNQKYLYAGTADLIGVWNGQPTIIDFKQSNKPKNKRYITDYVLQICAYINAHNLTFGTDIDNAVILICNQCDLEVQIFECNGMVDIELIWNRRLEEFYANY